MVDYTCGICGTQYTKLDNYVKCVTKCGAELKAVREEEAKKKRLEEINMALNKVKQAKSYYEEQLALFAEKYPEEYMLNFGIKDIEKNANDDLWEDPESIWLANFLKTIKI